MYRSTLEFASLFRNEMGIAIPGTTCKCEKFRAKREPGLSTNSVSRSAAPPGVTVAFDAIRLSIKKFRSAVGRQTALPPAEYDAGVPEMKMNLPPKFA